VTILDRSDDGLVLDSLPDGTYAWLRPETPVEIKPVEIKEATPADLLATPARFAAWLNAQPANATVGRPHMSSSCPIAKFLTAEGFFNLSVSKAAVIWEWDQNAGTGHEAVLPRWARRFVDLIDVRDSTWPVRTRPVRASYARALLGQAVREAGL
jgi:hypothetical protein